MWTKKKKTKQKPKLGFLGFGLRTHLQAYVRKQDYVYADTCPENPKNTKMEQNHLNTHSNNLTCILKIQKRKPKLDKHVKTNKNKKTRQTEGLKA